jgi:hypothetical protein
MLAGGVGGTMKKISWLMVIIIALLLAGCSNTTTLTATLEASATGAVSTQITVTPSMTGTYPPEPTITLTPLPPTWTPQPTLNSREAQKLLSNLLKDNGGCKLPCFWGITPGETTWQEANNFLETFTSFSVRDFPDGIRWIEPLIPFPREKYGTIRHSYRFHNGVVESIQAYNSDLAPVFYLTNFLITYGPPSEVWIRTQAIEEQGSQPFEVALFYPEQGILMDYSGGNLTTVGADLRNCLGSELDSPFIFLWDVSEKMSFDQAIKGLLNESYDDPFLPLEEAAGMDAKTFYESFRTPGNNACIVTPKNLWPGGQ